MDCSDSASNIGGILTKTYVQSLDRRQKQNPGAIKKHPIKTVQRQSHIVAASVYTYDMLYFTDTHNSSISFYRFLTPQQKHVPVHGFRNLTLIQYN